MTESVRFDQPQLKTQANERTNAAMNENVLPTNESTIHKDLEEESSKILESRVAMSTIPIEDENEVEKLLQPPQPLSAEGESQQADDIGRTNLDRRRQTLQENVKEPVVLDEPTDSQARAELKVDSSLQKQEELEEQEAVMCTSSPDLQTKQHIEQGTTSESTEETLNQVEPLKMIRKGAVAAVGGAMVGVGLVMIPLPTPFGAVIASSGLAVLGTEFKAAKEMNDKIIDTTKEHLETARDKVIKSIESLDEDDEDQEESTSGDEDDSEDSPKWLQADNMNPAERKRQIKLYKEKYRKENQTTFEQMKESMSKRAGSVLSRTVLPFLKQSPEKSKESDEKLHTKLGECNPAEFEISANATDTLTSI